MEYLFIYLLQVAEVISNSIGPALFVWGALILLVVFGMIFCADNSINVFSEEPDDIGKRAIYCFKIAKRLLIGILIYVLIVPTIPTKQTLLLIGGTYLGKKAINTVITDEKIKKVDTIINLQLDKYIKELQAK